MDEADKYLLRNAIAERLDHPSVYMGGPSHGSIRRAVAIVNTLLDEYDITPKVDAKRTAEMVRAWRKSPWDSAERI